MEAVTKPIMLDETGQSMLSQLIAIASAMVSQPFTVSALTNNPSSVTLDSSAKRTYQTCTITSQTSITLSGGDGNPGVEHYILFHNTGSSDCVITPSAGMAAPSTITVKAGKYLEMAWLYSGSTVVITNSAEIG